MKRADGAFGVAGVSVKGRMSERQFIAALSHDTGARAHD